MRYSFDFFQLFLAQDTSSPRFRLGSRCGTEGIPDSILEPRGDSVDNVA